MPTTLLQDFLLIRELLFLEQDVTLVQLLNCYEDLSTQLPSYSNHREHTYTLLMWTIMYERVHVIDYLVQRESLCILHHVHGTETEDALAFSIKHSKHKVSQHLLKHFSLAFDLVKRDFTSQQVLHFCYMRVNPPQGRSVSYLEFLDYSHILDGMFNQNNAQNQLYQETKTVLIEKSRQQANSLKIKVLLKYKNCMINGLAEEVSKYLDFDVFYS